MSSVVAASLGAVVCVWHHNIVAWLCVWLHMVLLQDGLALFCVAVSMLMSFDVLQSLTAVQENLSVRMSVAQLEGEVTRLREELQRRETALHRAQTQSASQADQLRGALQELAQLRAAGGREEGEGEGEEEEDDRSQSEEEEDTLSPQESPPEMVCCMG